MGRYSANCRPRARGHHSLVKPIDWNREKIPCFTKEQALEEPSLAGITYGLAIRNGLEAVRRTCDTWQSQALAFWVRAFFLPPMLACLQPLVLASPAWPVVRFCRQSVRSLRHGKSMPLASARSMPHVGLADTPAIRCASLRHSCGPVIPRQTHTPWWGRGQRTVGRAAPSDSRGRPRTDGS